MRKDGERKIRVLRVIARLNVGGPAIHTTLLTRELDPERFESRLAYGRLGEGEGDMAYLAGGIEDRLVYLPHLQREISPLDDARAFFALVRLMLRERPDVVHTHTAKAGALGRAAALACRALTFRRVRLVHTFHGNVLAGYFGGTKTRVFRQVERALARFTDTVVAISPRQMDELVRLHKVARPERVRLIRLGFHLAPFFEVAQDRKPREAGEAFVAGIVGRLVPIKNHAMFLDAARRFLDKAPDTPARFPVVGGGELLDELRAQARDLGISDAVEFWGWRRDLPAVYAGLSAVVLTSDNEGTPVSLIEAMAASVPVAATDVGGVRDLLGEPEKDPPGGGFAVCGRGLLCRPGDAQGLAAALAWCAGNPEAARDMAVRGRDFVEETYGSARLVRDIGQLYEELVAGVPPGSQGKQEE